VAVRTQRSAEEILAIWQEFKADQSREDLRNQLIETYLPLVKYNGERIWARLPDGVELDDLVSAGTFGLMDAIDAFDMGRGVKFETYCVPRIRGAMLDELRTMDWVPRLVRSKASKLNEALKTLEARLGRAPADAEVAEHMGLSAEEFEKLLVEANAVSLVSLNKKWCVIASTWGRAVNWRPNSRDRSTAWLDREISRPVATDTNSAGTALVRPSPIVSRA